MLAQQARGNIAMDGGFISRLGKQGRLPVIKIILCIGAKHACEADDSDSVRSSGLVMVMWVQERSMLSQGVSEQSPGRPSNRW